MHAVMASRSSTAQKRPVPRLLYLLGLALIAVGGLLLLWPELDRTLLPVGALLLLLGVVMVGQHLIRQLHAEIHADVPMLEPGWRKPAHGAASFGEPPLAGALAPVPLVTPRAAQPVPESAWALERFDAMSAAQFETVCEALFAQGGFETRCQSHGAAGGVTLWLYSRHAQQGKDKPAAVAECKQ